MVRITFYLMMCLLVFNLRASAQQQDTPAFLGGIKVDGDTLPHRELEEVTVFPPLTFKSLRDERRYYRLEHKVKKVYPYAQKAAELLEKYKSFYTNAESRKERRKYIKQIEKELFAEYGDELKKLSISEGRILIKLIDRETGYTSYELIKDFKGGFVAFFWQGLARIFGNNLKDEYDPITEDVLIEQIIHRINSSEGYKKTMP